MQNRVILHTRTRWSPLTHSTPWGFIALQLLMWQRLGPLFCQYFRSSNSEWWKDSFTCFVVKVRVLNMSRLWLLHRRNKNTYMWHLMKLELHKTGNIALKHRGWWVKCRTQTRANLLFFCKWLPNIWVTIQREKLMHQRSYIRKRLILLLSRASASNRPLMKACDICKIRPTILNEIINQFI